MRHSTVPHIVLLEATFVVGISVEGENARVGGEKRWLNLLLLPTYVRRAYFLLRFLPIWNFPVMVEKVGRKCVAWNEPLLLLLLQSLSKLYGSNFLIIVYLQKPCGCVSGHGWFRNGFKLYVIRSYYYFYFLVVCTSQPVGLLLSINLITQSQTLPILLSLSLSLWSSNINVPRCDSLTQRHIASE